MEIRSENAASAWKQALRAIREHGTDFIDENANQCREILNMTITLTNPATVMGPLITMKSTDKWHYPSPEEIRSIIMDPEPGTFAYTYGSRLFAYEEGFNQIDDFIVPLLKATPHSRRAVITIWNPIQDENIESRAVPGMVLCDLKLRSGKLHITAIVRSADIFFGWPANTYQISLIQSTIAERLGVANGHLTTFCTSAHIFSYQYEDIDVIIDEER